MRDEIYQNYRQGASIEELAKNHRRTRSGIYRIISQIRAKKIAEMDLDYVDNPEFLQMTPEKERTVLGPMPRAKQDSETAERPHFVEVKASEGKGNGENMDADPAYLAELTKTPVLTVEQEQHQFRKLNYLKFKAALLRKNHDVNHPKGSIMGRLEKIYEQAQLTKNEIVSANLRLVVAIAKRHISPHFSILELISDGNMALMRAVDKFDYSRGNRFSTYATWAMIRNFARTIPDEKKHYDRFQSNEEIAVGAKESKRSDMQEEMRLYLERQEQIAQLLSSLNEHELKIIVNRFGIGDENERQTFRELEESMGLSQERVRQIKNRSLEKLRDRTAEKK